MKTPPGGNAFDRNNRPIYVGDLLKTFHFRSVRRWNYYLYHVACWNAEQKCMEAVPYSELATGDNGGRFWIKPGDRLEASEVIDGPMVDSRLHNERPTFKSAESR